MASLRDTPTWKKWNANDPDAAMAYLRSQEDVDAMADGSAPSVAGDVIRQGFSGLGEAVIDTAKAPFDIADMLGFDNKIDDAMEAFSEEAFPPAMTRAGEIARATGHGLGIGASFFLGASGAARAGIPVISKVGKFLSGGHKSLKMGLGVESTASAGFEAAAEVSRDHTDSELLRLGAGLVGGVFAAGLTGTLQRSLGKVLTRNAAAKAVAKVERSKELLGKHGTRSEWDERMKTDRQAREKAAALAEGEQAVPDPKWEDGQLPDNPRLSPDAQAAKERYDQAILDLSIDDLETMKAKGLWSPKMADTHFELSWKQKTEYMAEQMNDPRLAAQLQDAATEAMSKSNILLKDPKASGIPLYTQFSLAIKEGVLTRAEVDDILRGHGLEIEDLADVTFGAVGRQVSKAATRLQMNRRHIEKQNLTYAERIRLGHQLTPEQVQVLETGINPLETGWWNRLTRAWRGTLVSQLASGVRDYVATAGVVGVHTAANGMEFTLSKMFPKRVHTEMESWTDTVDTAYRFMASTKDLVPFGKGTKGSRSFDELADLLEADNNYVLKSLTSQFQYDLTDKVGSGALGRLEQFSMMTNAFRRVQERAGRKAVFNSILDARLAKRGTSLDELVESGSLREITQDDLKAAAMKAQELTLSSSFNRHSTSPEGVVGSIIHGINEAGIGPFRIAQILPFPRFMANSLKWQWDHSPGKFLQLLMNPKMRQQFLDGDMQPFIKATLGSALLLSAHQVQKAYGAGRWSDIRMPDAAADTLGYERGSVIDTRPYNPFSAYLFVADLAQRLGDGTLNQMQLRDVINGIASSNIRAGAGMFLVDSVLDGFAEEFQGYADDPMGMELAVAGFLGDYATAAYAGILTPLRQIKDFIAHFDANEQIIRDSRSERFTGQLKTSLPYAGDTLPPVQPPTQSDPLSRSYPWTKQLTGVTVKDPKSPAQEEIDRLGLTRRDLIGSSGDKEYDSLISKHMGPLVEKHINKFVQSDEYKKEDPIVQGHMLKERISRFRSIAKRRAKAESPRLWRKSKEGRTPRRTRRYRSHQARKAELERKRLGLQ